MAVTPIDDTIAELTAERFLTYGNITMEYVITGGEQSGTVREIAMKPCEDYSFIKTHYSDKEAKMIQAHVDAKQFFCPDAFDLSLYGMKTDLESKILRVEVTVESGNTFEEKKLAVLINNKRINTFAERTELDPVLQEYTSIHFLPISDDLRMTSTVTMQR